MYEHLATANHSAQGDVGVIGVTFERTAPGDVYSSYATGLVVYLMLTLQNSNNKEDVVNNIDNVDNTGVYSYIS